MDISKLNRIDLKKYFVKKALPTEAQFADLIDGMINQKDDGLVKLGKDSPLAILAAGTSADAKNVLELYHDFADTSPDFTIGLPVVGGKRGLNIARGNGPTYLFIDYETGKLGVGTNTPAAALHVVGGAQIDGPIKQPALVWTNFSSLSTGFTTDPTNRELPAYSKDVNGIVRLRGGFNAAIIGSAGKLITTLDATYRPAKSRLFCTTGTINTATLSARDGSAIVLEIKPTGEINAQTPTGQARWIDLDGISFEAA
jgi:hypothetical protein